MRWNTLANILSRFSIPFSMVGQLIVRPSITPPVRRSRSAARSNYFDALELRELFSGTAPAVAPFARTIEYSQNYTFLLSDFTNAFFDTENDTMESIQITQTVSHGTLTLTINGSTSDVTTDQVILAADIPGLVYHPENASTHQAFFLFTAFDGTSFAPTAATVTMTVEKPQVAGISKSFAVNDTFAFTDTDFTDAYTHSHPLATITIVSLPSHGLLQLSGNPVTQTSVISLANLNNLTFEPDANFVGGDSFTWFASDGTANSDSASVLLTTTTTLLDPATHSVFVNHTFAFDPSDVTGRYTGPGSADTVTILTLPANGTLSFTQNAITNNVSVGQVITVSELAGLVFTPGTDLIGTRTFTWQATAGTLPSNIATVTMTFDASLAADAKSTFVNTPVSFTSTDITDNFSDGSASTVKILTLPGHGKLTFTLNATTANVTQNQVIALADIAGLTFTPNTGYQGIDTFNWSVSNGTVQSNPGAVNLTINSPFTAFSKSMDQGTSVNFTASDFTTASVLTVNHVQILRLPLNGTLSLTVANVTHNVAKNEIIPLVNLSGLKYTPKASFTGTDTILWTSSADGNTFVTPGSVITLTVKATDVSDFSKFAGQNSTLSFTATDFSNNYSGGTALQTVKIATLPAHGDLFITSGTNTAAAVVVNGTYSTSDLANLIYVVDANYQGADTFTWTASGGGAFATPVAKVNLTVSALKITGNDVTILDNDTTPSANDFTDFLSTAASGPSLTRTYIITNVSGQTINLTGSSSGLIQLLSNPGNATTANFTVTSMPGVSTLAPNESASFIITFSPTATGNFSDTVTIATDTPGDPAFVFKIQGSALKFTSVTTTSTVSGLLSATTVAGKGTGAFNGQILHMTYSGRLLDGTVFDATDRHGNIPLTFRLDNSPNGSFILNSTTNIFVTPPPNGLIGSVIRGWEDGIQGMKPGEHRTLIIPSFFGYGDSGSGESIPGGATLIFDMVLVAADGSPSLGITSDTTGSAILPGDTTPNTADSTDFGTVPVGASSVAHSFIGTINSPTTFNGVPLGIIHQTGFSITGPNAKDFTFSGNMLGNFQIIFKPTAPGVRTATINFLTDDPLQKKFSFTVRGNSTPFVDFVFQKLGTANFASNVAIDGTITTTISLVIQNNGNSAVPSSSPTTNVRISIQNTADTTSQPIVVGEIAAFNLSGLGAGATKTVNVPITIPGNLTLSTYSFLADINTTGAIAESMTSNSVTLTQNITGKLDTTTIPDLFVHNQPVKGNVKVVVQNTGNLTYASNETVRITIQAVNGTVSTTDIATSTNFSVAGLKPGATKSFTVPVNFTTGLTDGTYTLQAVLDLGKTDRETSITDNIVAVNASNQHLTVVSAPPAPDLTVEFGTKRFTVDGGNTYTTKLPVTVTNAGNVSVPNNSSGSTDIRVFLRNTNDTSSTDIEVGHILHAGLGGLAATKTRSFEVPVKIPATASIADYVYLVTVNDSLVVAESDTTNNDSTSTLNIGGALVSSTLPSSIPHTAPKTRGSVTVRLQNDGDLPMPKEFEVTVQIVLHNVNSNVDTILNPTARTITPERWDQPGEFFDFAFVVNVPTALPAGNYILQAKLITKPGLRESDIADNTVSSNLFTTTIPITIT